MDAVPSGGAVRGRYRCGASLESAGPGYRSLLRGGSRLHSVQCHGKVRLVDQDPAATEFQQSHQQILPGPASSISRGPWRRIHGAIIGDREVLTARALRAAQTSAHALTRLW